MLKVRDIIQATAQTGGMTVPVLLGDGCRDTAHLRFVGMLASVRLTLRSYPALAQDWKRRDHTTIMHAERRAMQLIAKGDPMARERLRVLLQLLGVDALPATRPGKLPPVDRHTLLAAEIDAMELRLDRLRVELGHLKTLQPIGAVR